MGEQLRTDRARLDEDMLAVERAAIARRSLRRDAASRRTTSLDATLRRAEQTIGSGRLAHICVLAWKHVSSERSAKGYPKALDNPFCAMAAYKCCSTNLAAVEARGNKSSSLRVCLLAWQRLLSARSVAYSRVWCGVQANWQKALRLRTTLACWRQIAHCSALLRWRCRTRGLALLRVVVGTWRAIVFEVQNVGSFGFSASMLRNATPRPLPYRGASRQQMEEKTPVTPQRRPMRHGTAMGTTRPLGPPANEAATSGAPVTRSSVGAGTVRRQDSGTRRSLSVGASTSSRASAPRIGSSAARTGSATRTSPRARSVTGPTSGSAATGAKRTPLRSGFTRSDDGSRRLVQSELQHTRVSVIELGAC